MKRMNVLDASWLAVESEDTPMHVGNLQIFSLPENAPETFLRDMVARMKSDCEVVVPWAYKLKYPSHLGRVVAPAWVIDKHIDLDYHVRHSALPRPGGERELGVLVSRLHSNSLDFSRPLWECHIIEGLENNRFALYTKMHHSLIDGISGVRLLQRTLSKRPDQINMQAPWSIGQPRKAPGAIAAEPTVQGAMQHAIDALKQQANTATKLAGALGRMVFAAQHDRDRLAAPFVGPQSALNVRVAAQRRLATQQYSLTRLKELAKKADASLNDIVLYLCGTALRRFLQEQSSLPDHPLTAGIPVNIRPADDDGTGTAISFMIASLGTDVESPMQRLQTIMASTQTAKEHLQSMPRHILNQYTMLLMSPYILQLMTGLGGRMRPVFNVTISNVPGPEQTLYYEGAKLEAMYPVSLIAHGGALNITCLSYAGSLNFGYTGCRDTLPSMQRIAVYTGEALDELEAIFRQGKPDLPKAAASLKSNLPPQRAKPAAKAKPGAATAKAAPTVKSAAVSKTAPAKSTPAAKPKSAAKPKAAAVKATSAAKPTRAKASKGKTI